MNDSVSGSEPPKSMRVRVRVKRFAKFTVVRLADNHARYDHHGVVLWSGKTSSAVEKSLVRWYDHRDLELVERSALEEVES